MKRAIIDYSKLKTPSGKEKSFYQLAYKIAQESSCSDRHGVVIVRGKRVIAIATNRVASHPISAQWLKQSIHAEQRALIKASKFNANGATAYCARDHTNLISMPCTMCFYLMKEAGLAKTVFVLGNKLYSYDID